MFKKVITLLLLLFGTFSGYAEVVLPHILGSNMVLKRKSAVNIWGKTSVDRQIKVFTSWDKRSYTATADAEGKFKVIAKTPGAGGPFSITINDGDETVLKNILIGEVWLCPGQSNMEMPLNGYSVKQYVKDAKTIIASAANSQLRLFTVKKNYATMPLADCEGIWAVSAPSVAPSFSAVAFQFGQLLQQQLKVPVGIIHASVGGTPIRNWMGDSFDQFAEMYPSVAIDAVDRKPKGFFNGMIAPLQNFAISGFIWYQGEADRGKAGLYGNMQSAMAIEWRILFNDPNLGFYYAQIAPWTYPDDKMVLKSPYMREAQYRALKTMGKSGMAITADVGSDQSIHPPDKTTVAERLVRLAMVKTYGKKVSAQGPEFASMKAKDGKAILIFRYDKGLLLKEDVTSNFEAAGVDRIFYPATAQLVNNKVEVFSAKVKQPLAVRYCFKDYFIGHLYNAEGLPAVPFRTDDW